MDTSDIIKQAKALRERIQRYAQDRVIGDLGEAARAQVTEFLRRYAGPRSAFTKESEAAEGYSGYMVATLQGVLDSFVEYVESGLSIGLSPERRAQIDVVSDVLGQAQEMLDTKGYHPAASAVIVGACLEEFLRNWVDAEGLSIGNAKPGIDAYTKALRSADLISKQDVKDITSWAGTRNDAAHGYWARVERPERVRIMLDGVSLFMEQNTMKEE